MEVKSIFLFGSLRGSVRRRLRCLRGSCCFCRGFHHLCGDNFQFLPVRVDSAFTNVHAQLGRHFGGGFRSFHGHQSFVLFRAKSFEASVRLNYRFCRDRTYSHKTRGIPTKYRFIEASIFIQWGCVEVRQEARYGKGSKHPMLLTPLAWEAIYHTQQPRLANNPSRARHEPS